MNLPVLMHTARVWVEVFDYEAAGSPRTLPLPSLAKEVPVLAHELNKNINFMAFVFTCVTDALQHSPLDR